MKVGVIRRFTCPRCGCAGDYYVNWLTPTCTSSWSCTHCGQQFLSGIETANSAPAIIGQDHADEVDREPMGPYNLRKDMRLQLKSLEQKGVYQKRFTPRERQLLEAMYK